MDDHHKPPPTMEEIHEYMISSFITKVPSSSRPLARLFLEARQWDIDAAVSDFNESLSVGGRNVANLRDRDPRRLAARTLSNLRRVDNPVSSSSRPRSPRSPSRPARNPFSRDAIPRAGEQEHDAAKESSDDDLERALPPPSSSRRLKFRSMSEILSVTPQLVPSTVTVWRNGFTLDNNPLSTLDDPDNAAFLEAIESLESPRLLDSQDGKLRFHVTLIRRQQEDFPEGSPRPFQGVARTLASSSDEPPASSDSLTTEPTPSVDPTAPTTLIPVMLADGTRITSRFNTHHTIRDVRDFIDASTPGGSRDYQLLFMGFPPKTLTDLDQTIEQAGISNSLLTQKL